MWSELNLMKAHGKTRVSKQLTSVGFWNVGVNMSTQRTPTQAQAKHTSADIGEEKTQVHSKPRAASGWITTEYIQDQNRLTCKTLQGYPNVNLHAGDMATSQAMDRSAGEGSTFSRPRGPVEVNY